MVIMENKKMVKMENLHHQSQGQYKFYAHKDVILHNLARMYYDRRSKISIGNFMY